MRRATNPTRRSRLAVLGAAMAVCLAFAGVSAASAWAVPTWNAPGMAKVSGSVTFTANGQPNRTCAVNVGSMVFVTNGAPARIDGDVYFGAPCSSSAIYRFTNATASIAAGAWSINNNWNGLASPTIGPWGSSWKQLMIALPWTNAAGANPSKIVLNNTTLAYDMAGFAIRGTGTINFTTPAGGALTLSP